MELELRNKRLPDDVFFRWREEVLATWPTGREVDLDEAIAYHKSLPDYKSWPKVLAQGRKEGRILVGTPVGQTTIALSLDAYKALEAVGCDLTALYTDTYTRKCRYELAEAAIKESIATGRNLLNGFPVVNHGVKGTRQVIDSCNLPMFISEDEEPMLSQEVAQAGGCTGTTTCKDFSDLVQHCKDYPLVKRILNHQYSARLFGYYEEHGVPMEAILPASLCGFFPPALNMAINILCSLTSAEQGIRHISLQYCQQCNLIQDVAALHVYRKLGQEYLERFGYHDIVLSIAGFHWMGDFPRDEYQACALVAWCSAIDALGGWDWVWAKTPHEGAGIPTGRASAAAILLTRQVIEIMKGQRLPPSEELQQEEEIIELEVRSILDAVIDLGEGDLCIGEVRAIEAGILDVPFPSWIYAKGEVLPVRDAKGAVRYFSHGRLPLPDKVIKYHRAKIEERARAEGTEPSIEMVIKDVRALSRPLIKEALLALA